MQSKYFAQLENNTVIKVIVAEQDFIDTQSGTWIETTMDGSLRKNYASVGHTYDEPRDAFIAPKPFNSWILNENTCQWEPPIAYPVNNLIYKWDELNLVWEITND